MGYHKKEIPKGELGEWSKVIEEWEEFKDAHEQQCKILEICELADLIGAIKLYYDRYYNDTLFNTFRANQKISIEDFYEIEQEIVSLRELHTTKDIDNIYKVCSMIRSYTWDRYNLDYIDLYQMSNLTAEAFKEGKR